MEGSDPENNRRDVTSLLKDGLAEIVTVKGKDGKPQQILQIKNRAAWYKTHNINSDQFGMMAQYLEDFASYAKIVKHHMSKAMSDVLSSQINEEADIIRLSIDAKSSETMRNKRNAQTSLIDKYLENKQERVIDVKGELKRTLGDMIMGKEAEKSAS